VLTSHFTWTRRICAFVAILTLGVGTIIGLNNNADLSTIHATAVAAESPPVDVSTVRYTSKAIQDIRPGGDKVLADNPETPGQAAGDFGEFDRDTWRVLQLHVDKPDGGWMQVSLARPVTWIEQAQRNRDGRLWLELSELDIADWATVVGIDECPAQIEGQGRLVTGRFEHSSAEVLSLYVEGERNPIGTTASHPFWSQDRQAFVSAELLTATERLRLEDGRTAAVTRIEQLPGTQSVYNLEVDGEHVYHVGLNGVLVHNTCTPKGLVRSSLPTLPKRFAKEFDGPVRFPTFKAAEKVHRSPWIPDELPDNPGPWFGTRSTATKQGTDSLYQINKWNNPNEVLRTYEFTQDVTVYYGKVKGGTGYQVLFPKDITPGSVMNYLGEALLK